MGKRKHLVVRIKILKLNRCEYRYIKSKIYTCVCNTANCRFSSASSLSFSVFTFESTMDMFDSGNDAYIYNMKN